jgi:hypothetical protein
MDIYTSILRIATRNFKLDVDKFSEDILENCVRSDLLLSTGNKIFGCSKMRSV